MGAIAISMYFPTRARLFRSATVTSKGAITDGGNLTVTGATTLSSGTSNNITLNNANNFNTVAITSANNVILNDTNALIFGTSSVTGTLDVTTAGAITSSAALTIGDQATFSAGAGNDILQRQVTATRASLVRHEHECETRGQ